MSLGIKGGDRAAHRLKALGLELLGVLPPRTVPASLRTGNLSMGGNLWHEGLEIVSITFWAEKA